MKEKKGVMDIKKEASSSAEERDILMVREYQNLQRILYERKKRKRSG